MEIYFWLYLLGAALLIVAVPTVLLLLWRISAQLQTLIEVTAERRDHERV